MAQVSGILAKVMVGVTELYVDSWTLTEEAEIDDTTDTSTNGWKRGLACVKGFTGSFTALWDATAMPHSSPPDIKAGATLADCQFYAGDKTDGKYYEMNVLVSKVTHPNDRKGVRYTVDFQSQGEVTYPT